MISRSSPRRFMMNDIAGKLMSVEEAVRGFVSDKMWIHKGLFSIDQPAVSDSVLQQGLQDYVSP
jgi:hypothetical protein